MEVGRDEFEKALPELEEAIKGCEFVSVDTELTGLVRDHTDQLDIMDSQETRYARIHRSANDFLVVQYGICTFTWDKKASKYIAKPFNFPIFPQSGNSAFQLNRSFLTQPSSFEFLMKNGFDFNRWVRSGVPYLNKDEEAALKQKVGKLMSLSDVPIDENSRDFVDTSMADIDEWLQSSTDKTININASNSYRRRLIHQEVRKRYNSYLKTEGKGLYVEVTRLTTEERNAGKDVAHLLDAVSELVGFRKVIDMISMYKKPVVGHNMYLDLCHTFGKFNQDLPEDLKSFKTEVGKLFPSIYDTKYVAVSETKVAELFQSTALSDLFQTCCGDAFEKPNIEVHEDFQRYSDTSDKFHEAGYDAYVTGASFLKMLGMFVPTDSAGRIKFGDKALQPYLNKLYLMRSDAPYLNLSGNDDNPRRDNLVHVSQMPREWKTTDVQKHFFDAFGFVHIRWLGDSSCFLAVRDQTKYEDGFRTVAYAQEHGDFPVSIRIQSYDEFLAVKHQVEAEEHGIVEPLAKKRKFEDADENKEKKEEKEWTPNGCIVS
ncbi:hypothetical protein HDU97_003986 [Phlyctochytrium planicorne]|nr:hypothetical protein HDU97_003986 [Phlyctochytrium planicorne]